MIAAPVAQYLHDLGLVVYDPLQAGGNCFIDRMPDQPDHALGLFNYPGPEPDGVHGYDYPNLQVRARGGRDPREPQAWLAQVYDALQNLHAVALPGGIWVVSCYARQSGTAPLGPDRANRMEFTQNYGFQIRNVTAHRR